MLNKIQARTPLLALILFVFAVGYSVAAKVVVIPLGADDVNADVIQDLSDRIAALEIAAPSGRVSAFNSGTCPTGWAKYTNAQGRFVVGLNDGGELGLHFGTPLTNDAAQNHSHIWSAFHSSNNIWETFTSSGGFVTIIDWFDGMDNTGTGYYPISADNSAGPSEFYYTSKTVHTPPYVQLLYCEKV